MNDRLKFLLNRLLERLWVKPLLMVLLSISGAFLAKLADDTGIGQWVPEVSQGSIETLLSIISSSMLVIATFSVASMVSAYASASNTATPRTFPLIIADDVSQNALSTFIGAFIFSIVSLVSLMNEYYDKAGRFALFVLTLVVFALVIFTFVRWVDRIARLGRLGTTIDKVEKAAASALARRKLAPTLQARPAKRGQTEAGTAVRGNKIGYVQHIDISSLQECAATAGVQVRVACLPGAFAAPGKPLAWLIPDGGSPQAMETQMFANAFMVGHDRVFDEDPRFGLIVLSEIASRALSPAVNDPGTAIDIIGTFVRLLVEWREPLEPDEMKEIIYDRVEVPELQLRDMFDDAFTSIAHCGSGTIEVAERLQKAFTSLASSGDEALREMAIQHAQWALQRAEMAMTFPPDLAKLKKLAADIND